MNIARHVERGRQAHPERAALIFEGSSHSYRWLDEVSGRLCNSLRGLGVKRGDRVALLLPNIPAFLYCYIGIQKAGAISVSLSVLLRGDEIAFMLSDSGAVALITTGSLLEQVPRERLPGVALVLLAEGRGKDALELDEVLSRASPDATAVEMQRNDPAAILYSSGTTGSPKGVVLSHGNVISNIEAKRRYCGIRGDDRMLLFLPLYHCFGQNAVMNACLQAGGTLVLHRRFDMDRVLASLMLDGVNLFFAVPTIFHLILSNASLRSTDPAALQSVRYFLSAAAPLPVAVAEGWRERYGLPIHEGYGLTETSPFAAYNHESCIRLGSIGTPIAGVQMRVVSLEGDEALGPGEVGEIVIKGPNVMLGYWQRPQESAHAIRDGWFHTGDLGKIDEEGYFFLVDRAKDMIIVAGLKVYSAEVEAIIQRHSAVAEVAVYGVADPVTGERVEAQVVLRPGSRPRAADILGLCRNHIAEFKVPKAVHFVDTLPKGPTGKVLKRILRSG